MIHGASCCSTVIVDSSSSFSSFSVLAYPASRRTWRPTAIDSTTICISGVTISSNLCGSGNVVPALSRHVCWWTPLRWNSRKSCFGAASRGRSGGQRAVSEWGGWGWACLESLSHLELVGVGEVAHQLRELDPVPLRFLQQLVRHQVRSVLGRLGHLPRVWTGNTERGDRLPDDIQVLDLADHIRRHTTDRVPDDEEVCRDGCVLEERGLDEVVVQRRLGLSGIDRRKCTVRRLVHRIEHKRLTELVLRTEMSDKPARSAEFRRGRRADGSRLTLGMYSSLSSFLR